VHTEAEHRVVRHDGTVRTVHGLGTVKSDLGIGGLGHLAVQYAKAAGFETIAVSHSPGKDKMIRDLGAGEVVRDGNGLAAAGGADVILSTSNSTKAMVDSIQGLRPDGRLVTMMPTRSQLRSR
jgi:D-arabinose 1-dehydrogenase-like Zn-dependent alcohol dehydrogenase